ncbi:hypothetical protein ACFSQ3_07940 [Sphingobacterium corticis]|uniref:DUF4836 family protein n=1 Tax=Sphingobacterium corticis TaxID=1812823 RepID=A0ABW5NM22_9SPHI
MKYFIAASLAFFFGSQYSRAQDLVDRVPEHANVFVTLNTKAIFQHLDINDVNGLFERLGMFKALEEKANSKMTSIQDAGIDVNSKAYMYVEVTDSVQYLGGLLPLANAQQFEALVSSKKKIQIVQGLKTVYNHDKTIRLSFDDRNVYILGALPHTPYFAREDVRVRFNLPEMMEEAYPTYDYSDDAAAMVDTAYWGDDWAYADTAVVDDYWEETDTVDYEVVDSAMVVAVPAPVPAPPIVWDGDYDAVDSVLEQDQYADDYYLNYRNYINERDSLVSIIVSGWLENHMRDMLSGKVKSYRSKYKLAKMSDNVIADVQLRNFGSFYQAFLPADIFYSMVGYSKTPNFDYGVDAISGQLVVEGNRLLFKGNAELDREMSRYFRDIYAKKMNKKFLPHLQQDLLGFMSFAMDTEDYIKHMPAMMQRYYGPMAGRYDKFVDVAAVFFDVLLDEKAIAKVFKGDNLMVMYGVTPTKVTYTDYEYDDDYNYKEVEKEKTEQIPDFIWMFSSEDMRIFDKMIQIGVQESKVEDLGGIYALEKGYRSGLQLYFLTKDGVVYVGSNLSKLQDIKANKPMPSPHKPYVNMVRNDAFSVLFNTKRAPELFDEMNIPIDRKMKSTVEELGQYGDFYFRSSGIRKNKVDAEIAVDFPSEKDNALLFIFELVNRLSTEAKY